MRLFADTKIDFMKLRGIFVIVSAALLALGIFTVFIQSNLNLGIDFAGGTQIILRFADEPEVDSLRDVLSGAGLGDVQIQRFGDNVANEVLIRTPTVEGSEEGSRNLVVETLDGRFNSDIGAAVDLNRAGAERIRELLTAADPDNMIGEGEAAVREHYAAAASAIIATRRTDGFLGSWDEVSSPDEVTDASRAVLEQQAKLGAFSVIGVENVGPQIGEELRYRSFLAVLLSLIVMLAYIWLRFELRFGIGALVALVHDVIIALGLFALARHEFNVSTIAAFLTVIGYSVNDSVVIFDRVRENLRRSRRKPLVQVINESLNQTLSRTFLTSTTTLLVVGPLYIVGGDVIRGFAFVLMVGVVIGTYSSIFVACPFALLWEKYFSKGARTSRAAARA